MNFDEILEIRFDSDAGENLSIRGYLRELLVTLWSEGEGFSGKRPFGNSGWEYDIYSPLIRSGALKGKLDDDGCILDVDEQAGHSLVLELIDSIFIGERK